MAVLVKWLAGLGALAGCLWLGAVLKQAANLAIPEPVLAVLILVAALAIYGRVPVPVRLVADFLLRHMALFFIPALVGLLALNDLLADILAPLLLIIIVSTVLPLWTTAWIFQKLAAPQPDDDEAPHAD